MTCKSFFTSICRISLAFAAITVFAQAASSQESRKLSGASLPVVGHVDLERYAGTWYEIAKLPNRFQKKCARDTQAHYVLLPNGEVAVTNSCTTHAGKRTAAKGIAWAPAPAAPAKLKVSFVPLLKHLHLFGGNYWILKLASDYSWVLVGSPDRKYLWILSRGKTLAPEIQAMLRSYAEGYGFAVEQLVPTPQT